MKLVNIIIVILAVSMCILGSTAFLGSLSENYGENIDYTGLNKTQERMDKTNSTVEQIRKDIQKVSMRKGLGVIYIPYDLIKVGWGSLKLTLGSILTVNAIFSDSFTIFGKTLPLPRWFLPTILSMILISVLFLIVYGIYKWKFET